MGKKFLRKREVTFTFAVIAVIGGLFFSNQSITGNITLSQENPINLAPIIGGLLLVSAIVLFIYSFKKK